MNDLNHYKRAYEIQKQARIQAEKALEDKSRAFFEKNRALQEALAELQSQSKTIIAQEKLASIGELSAGLAHEINNPNAFIKSNLSILVEVLQEVHTLLKDNIQDQALMDQLEEKLEDSVAMAQESIEGTVRIGNIVQSMRGFSEPDPEAYSTIDLNHCVKKGIHLVETELGCTETIVFEPEELPEFSGIPVLLTLAVSQIIKNAVEANPKGEKILVKTKLSGEQLELYVADKGSGLSDKMLERAFEPFATTKIKHHGFGLSIVRHILHQHRGEITLSNNADQGATAFAYIPLK